jgi:hypothetical protein
LVRQASDPAINGWEVKKTTGRFVIQWFLIFGDSCKNYVIFHLIEGFDGEQGNRKIFSQTYKLLDHADLVIVFAVVKVNRGGCQFPCSRL